MKKPVINIEGFIGASKSTLAKVLSEELGLEFMAEPVNMMTELFYKDTDKYGFPFQIYMLNKRFAMMKKALNPDNNDKGYILDRSVYGDSVFYHTVADGTEDEVMVEMYDELLLNILDESAWLSRRKHPDLMIWLDVPLEKCVERIGKRGREMEQIKDKNDPLYKYYEKLYNNYQHWYKNYYYSPKVSLDLSMEWVDDEKRTQEIVKQVKHKLNELGYNYEV